MYWADILQLLTIFDFVGRQDDVLSLPRAPIAVRTDYFFVIRHVSFFER